jgi:hypothetical protein
MFLLDKDYSFSSSSTIQQVNRLPDMYYGSKRRNKSESIVTSLYKQLALLPKLGPILMAAIMV